MYVDADQTSELAQSNAWPSALQQAYADKSWAVSGSIQLSAEEIAERADRLLTRHMAHITHNKQMAINAVSSIASVLKVGILFVASVSAEQQCPSVRPALNIFVSVATNCMSSSNLELARQQTESRLLSMAQPTAA